MLCFFLPLIYSYYVLTLIKGNFGPFETEIETEVPLWLAIQFKKNEKCKLHKPEWLTADTLERVLAAEKQDSVFQHLPFHYMEMAQVIMRSFRDEFIEPDKVLAILEDIENVRLDRVRLGIGNIAKETAKTKPEPINHVGLRNASSMELLVTKKFLLGSLSTFDAFHTTDLSGVQLSISTDSTTGATGRKLRRYR